MLEEAYAAAQAAIRGLAEGRPGPAHELVRDVAGQGPAATAPAVVHPPGRREPVSSGRWAEAQAAGRRRCRLTSRSEEWSADKIAGYNQHLSGKILIPQPFGQLRNLHEPAAGLCISKFMVVEVVVALLMLVVFSWLGKKAAAGGPPRGRLWNFLEVFLVYLRDKVARPAIGEHDGDRFVPLLWTIFMFILACNLCGMLPWVGRPTSSFGVTTAWRW